MNQKPSSEMTHANPCRGQDTLNWMVAMQNSVYAYLCVLTDQHGELQELDAERCAHGSRLTPT